MNCTRVQERLLLYLAGELNPNETVRLVAHLAQCEECSTLLEETAENRDMLREAVRTMAQPPESLEARILERVKTLPQRHFPWAVQNALWSGKQVSILAASAVLLFLLGYQWGRSSKQSLATPMQAMASIPMLDLASLVQAHLAWKEPIAAKNVDRIALAERLSHETGLHVPPFEMQESDLHLKAGEALQMNHVPVATRRYNWKGTPVTLVQADGMRLAPPSSLREMRGHGRCFLVQRSGDLTLILWCEGADNFALVARLPPLQLFALVCQVLAKPQAG